MTKISQSDDRRGQRCRRAARNLGLHARRTTRRACPGWVLQPYGGDVLVEGLSLTELEVVLDRCGDDLLLLDHSEWFGPAVRSFDEKHGANLSNSAGWYFQQAAVVVLEAVRGQVQQVLGDFRVEQASLEDLEYEHEAVLSDWDLDLHSLVDE